MPSIAIKAEILKIPGHIELADPEFYKPGPVDMLIGADLFWQLLGTDKIILGRCGPYLQETKLRWIVSGPLGVGNPKTALYNFSQNRELLQALTKFWEVEEMSDHKPLIAAPDEEVTDVKVNRLDRFQLIQQMSQHFWRRWKTEYISELQLRQRWRKTQGTLLENALILLKDDHTLPTQWPLERIMHLHPGPDGIYRVATIKTSTGIVKRGFQKICPLPLTI
ncbi:hypothetical protein JTB14_025008 [Gonioctena quinquepunctata]|nr:hypothetical protein JTB14_025008 [Gonioctena quinquepunctata]